VNQPKKNPHSAAHYGVYAFKPKSQLAMVDSGIDPYMGVAVWLEAHRQNEFKYRPAQDRTAVQRFGEMSGAEVLQVLLPLFIVLMTFSAFAGEREQGTLRQLLSLGVSGRTLALGKAAGIAAALSVVLLPATIIGVIAMALTAEGGYLAGDPWRAVLLTLAYLAYFAVFVALSLTVSAKASSSRLALVALLTFWFVNGLVATRAAADVAATLHPTPSAVAFQQAMEAELGDPHDARERMARLQADTLKKYGVASLDALPVAFSGISLQSGEDHANEVFDRHYGRLFDTFADQNTVFQSAGLLAPTLAVRAISMGLAGTDFEQHRHFITAAEAYRRDIQQTLNNDIALNQKPGQTYLAGAELWNQVPEFDYTAPPTSWVLGNVQTAIGILALWMVLGGLLLFRSASTLAADV